MLLRRLLVLILPLYGILELYLGRSRRTWMVAVGRRAEGKARFELERFRDVYREGLTEPVDLRFCLWHGPR